MLLFEGDGNTGLMTAPVPTTGTAPTQAVSAGTSQLPAVAGAGGAAGLGAERNWTDEDLDSDEPEETPRRQQKKRSPWTWPLHWFDPAGSLRGGRRDFSARC